MQQVSAIGDLTNMTTTRQLPKPSGRRIVMVLLLSLTSTLLGCKTPTQAGPDDPKIRPIATGTPDAPATGSLSTPIEETPTAPSTPVDRPWVVSLTVTEGAGTSHNNGHSIKVSSEGVVERTRWQNGIAGAMPHTSQSEVAKDSLDGLIKALGDPALDDTALAQGQGDVVLTATVGDKTRTFSSQSETFSGAAGRVREALASLPGEPAPTGDPVTFSLSLQQPAPASDQESWEARTFTLDSNGAASSTYDKPAYEHNGRWTFVEGQLDSATLEAFKAKVKHVELPAEGEKKRTGSYLLVLRMDGETRVFSSSNGDFEGPGKALAEALKSSFAGGASNLLSRPWRVAGKPSKASTSSNQ